MSNRFLVIAFSLTVIWEMEVPVLQQGFLILTQLRMREHDCNL